MEPPTSSETKCSTPRASLAALGCYLHQLDFFGPIRTGVRITALDDFDVLPLLELAAAGADDPAKMRGAYAYRDDQRGGRFEISFKEDKPGWGGHQRTKKRFPAQ